MKLFQILAAFAFAFAISITGAIVVVAAYIILDTGKK